MPRILSLDGGGSWALIQVRALIDLYGWTATGYDVLQDFDLVVANSGGSIVAGALAAGWPLSDTLNFFLSQHMRQSVFTPASWFDRVENSILGIGPKYSTAGKLAGLNAVYGGFAATAMSAIPGAIAASLAGHSVNFIITAFDYDLKRAVLFRSDRMSPVASSVLIPDVSITDAVNASSTAPVNYFDSPALYPASGPQYRFWDGGVSGLNNPVLIGVMELLGNGVPANQIQVLSLGTGTVRLPVAPNLASAPSVLFQDPDSPGTLNDIKKLAGAIVDDPPDEATYLAYLALGGALPPLPLAAPYPSTSLIRMSPVVQPLCVLPDEINLSNTSANLICPPTLTDPALTSGIAPLDNFDALSQLDMDAVEPQQINQLQLLSKTWLAGGVYNQPIRSNRTFGCEIGHRYYPAAKAAWLAIVGRAPPPPPPAPPFHGPDDPSKP
jgi:hypothetical protein